MFSTIMITTFSYILGILLSPIVSLSSLIIFSLLSLLVFIAGVFLKKFKYMTIPLALIMLIVGGIRYSLANQNSLYETFPDKYVTVTGTVISIPDITTSQYKYRYTVKIDYLNYLKKDYKIDKKILINSKEELAYGDKFSASGFLGDFNASANEFEFNYKNYCKSKNIVAKLTAQNLHILGKKTSFFPTFLAGKLKYKLFCKVSSTFSGEEKAMLMAILFGNRTYFSNEYKTLLTKTGLLRVLYSPFLHLTLLAVIAGLLFANRNKREFALVALIALYLIVQSDSAIAIKSGLLLAIFILKKQISGYANKADILSFIVLTLTIINPMLCFNGGFMLSVISTLIIHFFYTPMFEFINKRKTIKSFWLSQILTIWLLLFIGTLPYAAYYFNGVSTYSILLAQLFMPFVIITILLAGFLLLVGGNFVLFLMPLKLCLSMLKTAPYIIEKLPFYYIMLRTPSIIEIMFWTFVFIIFMRIIAKRFNTIHTKTLITISLALLVTISLDFSINSLKISFINVGQGDACVLKTSRFETVIIDGGGSSDYQKGYNIGDRVFLPYLISHGNTNIDVAILTHFHQDHSEGIVSAIKNLKVNTIVMPDVLPNDKTRKEIESIAKSKNIKTEFLKPGDKIEFPSGLLFEVLAPSNEAQKSKNKNNNSLVLKVSYGEFSSLFMGDYEMEESLLPPKDIDLLKVSHHGSVTGNSENFIKKVSPQFAIISVGKNNSYGLPDKEVLTSLKNANSNILRTDKLGDIRFKISKNGNIQYSSLYGGN